MPWAPSRLETSRASSDIAPTLTIRTSFSVDPAGRRASTSTPSPSRSMASTSAPTVPLEKRTTVGASLMATASRSSSRSREASRGAARCRPGHDLDHGHVPHAVVAGAVRPGHAGAVQDDGHAGLMQGHVHQELVEGAVEEGGIDGHHGVESAEGHAGGGGQRVLLGDADVDHALGVLGGKLVQANRDQHGSGDANDVVAFIGDVARSRRQKRRSRTVLRTLRWVRRFRGR